jgi:chromosome segregation ATPase
MDWNSVAASVLSASFVAALSYAYIRIHNARFGSQRQTRLDEIGVLQDTLNKARSDIDTLRKELIEARAQYAGEAKAKDKELLDLKDEHTAVLVEAEGFRKTVDYLTNRVADKDAEIAALRHELQALHAGGTAT